VVLSDFKQFFITSLIRRFLFFIMNVTVPLFDVIFFQFLCETFCVDETEKRNFATCLVNFDKISICFFLFK